MCQCQLSSTLALKRQMNRKLKISELVDAIDMQSEYSSTYFNKNNLKFLYVNDDVRYEADSDKSLEEVTEWMQEIVEEFRKILDGNDENYVSIPDKFELHEYRIMEKFCNTIETEQIANQLIQSIKGKGAFRRFKNTLYKLGLEQRWYEYRDEAFRGKAKDWCEFHEIEFIDK